MTPEPGGARGARLAWIVLIVVAAAAASLGVAQWLDALASGRPILYGEGAVAHAALLFRDGSAYRDATGVIAANYPPLYVALASLGDPFRTGRALTILSAVAVAAILAWRARDGGPLASAGLGLLWLALAPVAIWGAAVKPDLFAVALTLGGVALLEHATSRGTRGAAVAGAFLAAAIWAKPTAILPAAAVLVWAAGSARSAAVRAAAGAALVALIALADALAIGAADVWRHVVSWNALPWSAEQTVLVGVLGAATLGVIVVAAALGGAFRGIRSAYVIGALAIALLAGREGATINYLLDLAAATAFALAGVAGRLRATGALPIAAMVQLAIAIGLLTPYAIFPGRVLATGAWGRADRADVVRALGPGDHLVEDSGLLVAEGRAPSLDDLFLWSRLVHVGGVDPAPVLTKVRSGSFASVVSEADLERLDQAPAYERARWEPSLVSAILERYALEHQAGALWVYRPR